jgi:nucleoside-diphosphate-sugar epimerase
MAANYDDVQSEIAHTQRTWLVTGGAGFIGSHLAEKLLALGQRVRVLDNLATGKRSNVPPAAELIVGDVADAEACAAACAGVHVVLHQAALGSVPRSLADPAATHRANVDGFVALALAARDAQVRRFVYASSSSVYGDEPALPKVEARIGRPLSPYAASKRIDEIYAGTFQDAFGIEMVGLRYFNVFGPRQSPDSQYAAVVPLFIRAIAAGEPVTIHGDGEQSRDFTYVDNVVAATILAAGAAGASGRAFNVAGGTPASVNTVAATIGGILGKPVERTSAPSRPGDIRDSWADLTAARETLGYAPSISLEDGLRRTAEALLS